MRECPKCNAPMETGFLIESNAGTNIQTKWIEGEPEASIWVGLKTKGRAIYPITTYRCTGCGYLESYTLGASETLLRAAQGTEGGEQDDLLRALEEVPPGGTIERGASGGEDRYQ